MIDNQYLQKAIDWLNSDRDFDEGVSLLQAARFRPAVVMKLVKDKNRAGVKERLLVNVQSLVSAFCTTDNESYLADSDPELHVFDGKEDEPTATPDAEKGILSHENDDSNLGVVVKRYAELYRQRDKAFKQMKQVGEKNDEASCIIRKQLSDQIESCTDQMEKLYPYYEKYTETGEPPTDDDIKGIAADTLTANDVTSDPVSEAETDYSTFTKEELTKEQYNIAKRIARTRNKILYQSENRLAAENPLPEGSSKRIKLEKRINKLEQQLEHVKVLIAQMS